MLIDLIVYLEPPSEIKQQVDHFLDTTADNIGFTTANKYRCHVSMTGFFQTDHDQMDTVKEILDKVLQHDFKVNPKLDWNPLIVKDKLTSDPYHVLLPVSVSDEYRQCMQAFAKEARSKLDITVRPKRIDHISLAYWDEHEKKDCRELFEKIKEAADAYFNQVGCNGPWSIVLYQRSFRGDGLREPHIFKEISRWNVQQ